MRQPVQEVVVVQHFLRVVELSAPVVDVVTVQCGVEPCGVQMPVVHDECAETGVLCEVGQLLVHVRPRLIDCDDMCMVVGVANVCRQRIIHHFVWTTEVLVISKRAFLCFDNIPTFGGQYP